MIKSDSSCSSCMNDTTNTCDKVKRCSECPNYTNGDKLDAIMGIPTHCRCLTIKYGEECPYYKEAKDGQTKE